MRIVLFIASEGWGGAEKVFVELANELAASCEVHVVLLKGTTYDDRFNRRVNIVMTPVGGSRRNPLLLISLYRIIKRIGPDIVHTHAAKATEMYHRIGGLLGARHVATKHNARKGSIFNRIRWVTTVSQRAAGTIRNGSGVEVIYNGIIPREIDLQKKEGTFTLVAVGRLDTYKGFDILIREVSKLTFPFVLNIVGEGAERRNLEKQIRRLQLEDRVFLPGHREDVPEFLARAHVQIISSRTEGFGLVLVEGLFYADMLLSTKVGIATEILPDELLLDERDMAVQIAAVHDNYAYFADLFNAIRSRQKNRFILRNTARKYRDLYARMLQVA